jgi:hypothetical protein
MCGCLRRQPVVPSAPAPASSPYWVGLQRGWRVRVVIPILKSGGYQVKTKAGPLPAAGPGSAITLSAGPDFLGYEVSIYAVRGRAGGGVRVVFRSAKRYEKGRAVSSRHTIRPLFRLPKSARWVRILHLIRYSPADHNSAILAADHLSLLETLTRQVKSDPSNCKSGQHTFCAWVPLGIAVIPESKKKVQGKRRWVAAT